MLNKLEIVQTYLSTDMTDEALEMDVFGVFPRSRFSRACRSNSTPPGPENIFETFCIVLLSQTWFTPKPDGIER